MCQVLWNDEAIGAYECLAGGADALLAVRCEWDVRDAGVTAIEGPFRLAMADDEDSWSCHLGRRSRSVPGVLRAAAFEAAMARCKKGRTGETRIDRIDVKGRCCIIAS